MTQNASSFKTKQNKETCYKQRTKIISTEGTQQANFKGQSRSWEWLTRAHEEKKKQGWQKESSLLTMEIKTAWSSLTIFTVLYIKKMLNKNRPEYILQNHDILQNNLKQKRCL